MGFQTKFASSDILAHHPLEMITTNRSKLFQDANQEQAKKLKMLEILFLLISKNQEKTNKQTPPKKV